MRSTRPPAPSASMRRLAGRRVAVTTTTGPPPQTATTVQYLHQDHLGSTGLVTTADGAFTQARFQAPFGAPWYTPTTTAAAPALGTRFGEPWPTAGTQQAVPAATDRHYTGQRSFEASLGSLYHYQARWYSPVLGRFLSPDPIVPAPGNPQDLNRYAYVRNNPYTYTDPSGYDPLDQEWRDAFREKYGRMQRRKDELIRLFVIAGLGDESDFYNKRGVFLGGINMNEIFKKPPADRNWGRMPEVLERLAQHYERDESRAFVRDVAALFAGLRTRSEASSIRALKDEQVRLNVYLAADDTLDDRLLDNDGDRNVHHWAAFLLAGHVFGSGTAGIANTGREVVIAQIRDGGALNTNMADVRLGNAAALMGDVLRTEGVGNVGALLRFTLDIR